MRTESREAKVKAMMTQRQEGIIVLEDVHDPHNIAAVLRSCDAFGFHQVRLIFLHEKPYNPRRIGRASSSSANKWLNYSLYRSTEECFKGLKEEGYRVLVTALTPDSQSIYDVTFDESKVALVFGNEHRGVSETALSMADGCIQIPMTGMVQSLNISVTAAICMFEITRQRKSLGMDQFLFSPERYQHFYNALPT